MTKLTVEDSLPTLLELAADNDIDIFKRIMEKNVSLLNLAAPWYVRSKKGSKQIVLEDITPLMVAATYGSLDVLKLILSETKVQVNLSSGPNKTTALHCAASSGAVNALEVVETLLLAGADPNILDNNGDRPIDVIVVPPKQPGIRTSLERLLMTNALADNFSGECNLGLSSNSSALSSPVMSSSPENRSPSSLSDSTSSPVTQKSSDLPVMATEKKEYPIDPTLPDIKNSIYSTDEFRMFAFKIRPCSRAYSHDWTECPFAHPGENARRRDPRKYHYSCEPCPDFHKGACRRRDLCEYAHGVFECWLHPAQYRTRLCKDGTSCARRVCFFAHVPEELRPLYASTASAAPSPRSSSATALFNLLPGSPSSLSGMSSSPFGQPMSPSSGGMPHSSSFGWPPQNGPVLHLPGSNLQSSRLRASLNARDISDMDRNMLAECDAQKRLLDEINYYSLPRTDSEGFSHSACSKILTPSNLESLFTAEVLSPRYSDQATFGGFSPSQKQNLINQFHQQQQSMLSPINTSMFSPRNADHSLLQASFGVGSPGRMSPRNVEQQQLSPMGSRLSVFAQRGAQNQQLLSNSSCELESGKVPISTGSPGNPWSNWGHSNGKVDWTVQGDEMLGLKRSSSFELKNKGDEPDLSWIQSLVTESPPDMKETQTSSISNAATVSGEGSTPNTRAESTDQSAIGSWLEQMVSDPHLTYPR